MDALMIGDAVRVADGTFSMVYSFGHYEPHAKTEFVQIFTHSSPVPLEITANHLLYTKSGKDSAMGLVPAGTIQVGDTLVATSLTQEALVHQIRYVTRTGAYSPLTTAGHLVVNGVIASNYVTRDWLPNFMSYTMQQYMQHGAALPYQFYCAAVGGCNNETYNDVTGFSPYVQFWYGIEQWHLKLHPVGKALFLPQ